MDDANLEAIFERLDSSISENVRKVLKEGEPAQKEQVLDTIKEMDLRKDTLGRYSVSYAKQKELQNVLSSIGYAPAVNDPTNTSPMSPPSRPPSQVLSNERSTNSGKKFKPIPKDFGKKKPPSFESLQQKQSYSRGDSRFGKTEAVSGSDLQSLVNPALQASMDGVDKAVEDLEDVSVSCKQRCQCRSNAGEPRTFWERLFSFCRFES